MSEFAQVSVPPSVNQLVLLYNTPIRGGAQCTGIIVYGNADCEYTVYKNTTQITGGRTSAAQSTLHIDLSSNPIGLIGSDLLSVYASHNESTSQTVNCTLLTELL
jgi:hypothetical protein